MIILSVSCRKFVQIKVNDFITGYDFYLFIYLFIVLTGNLSAMISQ
jgi:hypothetical protein